MLNKRDFRTVCLMSGIGADLLEDCSKHVDRRRQEHVHHCDKCDVQAL